MFNWYTSYLFMIMWLMVICLTVICYTVFKAYKVLWYAEPSPLPTLAPSLSDGVKGLTVMDLCVKQIITGSGAKFQKWDDKVLKWWALVPCWTICTDWLVGPLNITCVNGYSRLHTLVSMEHTQWFLSHALTRFNERGIASAYTWRSALESEHCLRIRAL